MYVPSYLATSYTECVFAQLVATLCLYPFNRTIASVLVSRNELQEVPSRRVRLINQKNYVPLPGKEEEAEGGGKSW